MGAQLCGVTYHYLPPADRTYYAGGERGVDCDLAAVDLDFGDRGTTAITWAMAGEPARSQSMVTGRGVRAGLSMKVTVSGRPNATAVLCASLPTLPLATPLGQFWLDPLSAVVLDNGPIDGSGLRVVTVPIPLGLPDQTPVHLRRAS